VCYCCCATVGQNVKVRVATVNVGTMVGRCREVGEMLARRRVEECCVQDDQYKSEVVELLETE